MSTATMNGHAFADAQTAGEAYSSMGWPIFPCHTKNGKGCTCGHADCGNPAKHPRTENGVLDATTDCAVIERWATSFRNLNWGLATGATAGVFGLDEDPRHGGDKSLADLEARYGKLPPTIEAITGGGGRHLLFRHPGGKIGNRTGGKSGMPDGLDVRGDGGYLIVAPANHISGGVYRWREGHAPGEIEAADAPAWLLEIVVTKKNDAPHHEANGHAAASDLDQLMRAAGAYVAKAGAAKEGHRNGSAFGLAGHLAAFVTEAGTRLSEKQSLDLLRTWNHRNDPPLDERELAEACASAYANGTPRPDKLVKRKAKDEQSRARKRKGKRPPDTTALPSGAIAHIFTEAGRTDATNAQRFAGRYRDSVRWCDQWNKWLVWDGKRWGTDNARAVVALAKEIWRELWAELGSDEGAEQADLEAAVRWAQYTASARGIRAMMELAKPDLAILPEVFDRDQWLLNCLNGTVELRTGKLREHRRNDYLTKLCPTPFDPSAPCPTWLAFLDTILAKNAPLIRYLQRLTGYWSTASVKEQILPIAYGTGSNGKSTWANAIKDTIGKDYAITADRSIVVAKKNDAHSTERMDLAGKRLALINETDEGQAFAEAFVKQLTGGDDIRGRRMREDSWEYVPTHKVLLVTNHKPRVRATDWAFWRRVKLIHFAVTIPDDQQDKTLPEKLKAEHPGILAWAVRGCLDWQREGLAEPDCVRKATDDYRAAEDVIGQWIGERCTTGAVRAKKTDVLKDYREWCEANNFHAATSTRLTQTLAERGYGLDTGRRWYEGIGLRNDTTDF